jgi:hypothetical protein
MSTTLPTFTDVFEAAKFYAGLGWCVLPILKDEKFPSVKWKPYQTVHPTTEELEGWFKDKSSVRIGLLTGETSGVVVVDADSMEAVAELQRRGVWSPCRVSTHRGIQLFFRRGDEAVSNSVGIIPSVDIRGDRGIAVLPPSIHKSGKVYSWEGWAEDLPAYNPAWFPEKAPGNYNRRGWITECLNNLEHLPRRPTLIKIAGRLLYNGWSLEDAATILFPHAEAAGLSEGEFFNCIESIRSYESTTELTSLSSEDLTRDVKEPDFLVDGVLPRMTTAIFGGVPKMGKSFLTMDLALELSRGGKWLGLIPCARSRVLYFDEENASPLLGYRVKAMLQGKSFTPDKSQLQFVVGQRINFSNPQSLEKVKQKLHSFKPDLVVVDSLIRASNADENSSRDMAAVFAVVNGLVQEFKCSFVFVDHEGKGSYARKDSDVIEAPTGGGLRGTSEKAAFADAVFSYRKQQGIRILYQTDARWTEPIEPIAIDLQRPAPGVMKLVGEELCEKTAS